MVRAECHALLGPINPGDQISDTWGMARATDHSCAVLHGRARIHNRTQTVGQIAGTARTHNCKESTQTYAKLRSGPRTRARSQTHTLSRKLFFQNILSFSYFSHIIICMSAWWDDSHIDKTLCSTQLLLLSHAHRLKIAYLVAQGHRLWFCPWGERGEDDSLCLHVYVFAQFLIASVRGYGLWGESATDNKKHFVFACISHSKNNQRW